MHSFPAIAYTSCVDWFLFPLLRENKSSGGEILTFRPQSRSPSCQLEKETRCMERIEQSRFFRDRSVQISNVLELYILGAGFSDIKGNLFCLSCPLLPRQAHVCESDSGGIKRFTRTRFTEAAWFKTENNSAPGGE